MNEIIHPSIAEQIKNCCSFEAEVKGVMFYEGRKYIDSFSYVYFEHDASNIHHKRACVVKLCGNDKAIGHLSYSVAEAIYELIECRKQYGGIKILG